MNMIVTVTVGCHDFSELLFFQDYYTVSIFNELKKQEVGPQFVNVCPQLYAVVLKCVLLFKLYSHQ